MPTEQIFWQFKDTELTSKDVNEFVGATHRRWEPGTVLRFRCKRATRDAKRRATEENALGLVKIIIEEDNL